MPAIDVMKANPRHGTDGPWGKLKEPRLGVMLHYDASASDRGALLWLLGDPACKVSYNWLILDDGTIRDIAPANARAFHAGACAPSAQFAGHPYRDANSAFFGIAFAATKGDVVAPVAFRACVDLVAACFRMHGWPLSDAAWRVTDHARESVYERTHPRTGQRGRKGDIGTLLQGVDVPKVVAAVEGYPASIYG